MGKYLERAPSSMGLGFPMPQTALACAEARDLCPKAWGDWEACSTCYSSIWMVRILILFLYWFATHSFYLQSFHDCPFKG